MLTVAKGQLTQVQNSDIKMVSFAHILLLASGGGGLIKETKIPVQEHDSQRGEGTYFRGDTVHAHISCDKVIIIM